MQTKWKQTPSTRHASQQRMMLQSQNCKTRHTHLRSNRETRHTRLRSQSRDSTYSSSPYSQDSTYSSSLYSQDSKYSSSLSIITRFDILIFALLSNRKTRHTRLRSHRGIRYIHLRFQMARLGILVFALIREIRRYINLNFAQSQYDDRLEFRFIKMRRSIWISLHQCDDTSIWISLHQNATIHQFGFRFIKTSRQNF